MLQQLASSAAISSHNKRGIQLEAKSNSARAQRINDSLKSMGYISCRRSHSYHTKSTSTQNMALVRNFEGNDSKYKFIRPIGSGSFGRVWKVQRKRDGKVSSALYKISASLILSGVQILACKSINAGPNLSHLEEIRREIEILESLNHCRFCIPWDRDVAVDRRRGKLHLHMKYCNNGTLQHLIKR